MSHKSNNFPQDQNMYIIFFCQTPYLFVSVWDIISTSQSWPTFLLNGCLLKIKLKGWNFSSLQFHCWQVQIWWFSNKLRNLGVWLYMIPPLLIESNWSNILTLLFSTKGNYFMIFDSFIYINIQIYNVFITGTLIKNQIG